MQREVDTPGKLSCALHELHLRKGSQCSKCYASTQESDLDFVARYIYGQSDLMLAAVQCLRPPEILPASTHRMPALAEHYIKEGEVSILYFGSTGKWMQREINSLDAIRQHSYL